MTFAVQAIRLRVALKRLRTRFLKKLLICLGALWTLIELSSYFSAATRSYLEGNLFAFLAVLIVAALIAFIDSLPWLQASFRLPGFSTFVTLRFGDLFACEGHRVIPVNEFFDSQLGDHVSTKSLHGQLIGKSFGGRPEGFEAAVDESLRDVGFEVVERKSGRSRKYPIGTTAKAVIGSETYYLLAVTRTNIETLKAEADPLSLWIALSCLWRFARNNSGGHLVCVPLIGGGLAGTGIPVHLLLRMMLLSLLIGVRHDAMAGNVEFVLPISLIGEIDLESLAQEWG